jgi:hypothetical protein
MKYNELMKLIDDAKNGKTDIQLGDQSAKISSFGIGEAGKVPTSTPLDELEAEHLQPSPKATVKCSCGHTVPRTWVMNASLGTACPDCYDRMSD